MPQAAQLEAASLASNASLREAQGNLDELVAQSEAETVYLHTIFNELAIAEAPPPPAAGAVAPPPELPPTQPPRPDRSGGGRPGGGGGGGGQRRS